MAINELILHRFNGDEEFRLSTATVFAYRTQDVDGRRRKPRQTAP
jgi:hypothetical protein